LVTDDETEEEKKFYKHVTYRRPKGGGGFQKSFTYRRTIKSSMFDKKLLNFAMGITLIILSLIDMGLMYTGNQTTYETFFKFLEGKPDWFVNLFISGPLIVLFSIVITLEFRSKRGSIDRKVALGIRVILLAFLYNLMNGLISLMVEGLFSISGFKENWLITLAIGVFLFGLFFFRKE
jgi:hypothetical protein